MQAFRFVLELSFRGTVLSETKQLYHLANGRFIGMSALGLEDLVLLSNLFFRRVKINL